MTNPLKAYLDKKPHGEASRLARALGLSFGYVGDIANGRRMPTILLASRLDAFTHGGIPFADWKVERVHDDDAPQWAWPRDSVGHSPDQNLTEKTKITHIA